MKKVFLVHGFEGSPNGGWFPWLMGELKTQEIYAAALCLPNPGEPICDEWVQEIKRIVEINKNDEIFLVGHSLGVPAVLHYLEILNGIAIEGVVLVSGRYENPVFEETKNFFSEPFKFELIKTKAKKISIIHGDNDPLVSFDNAEKLAKELDAELIAVENGQHLNGSAGWKTLPPALDSLNRMMS